MSKWLGAKVFATCSSEQKMKIAKQLGADFSINYKNHSVKSYLTEYTNDAGFDVVFDTVGGDNLSLCFDSAALYGRVISILAAGNHDLTPAFMKGLSVHTVLQPFRKTYSKLSIDNFDVYFLFHRGYLHLASPQA